MHLINFKKLFLFTESSLGRHVLFWLFIIIYFSFVNRMDCSESSIILFGSLFSLSFIFSYYFLHFFIFPLANKKYFILVILGFLLSYGIFIGMDLVNFHFLFPLAKIKTQRNLSDLPRFIRLSSFWYAFVFFIAYANMKSIISLNTIKIINQKIGQGLLRELNILKHQFHSHLNYNFLNFCYSGLLKISREKAEIVDHYSSILSYSLHLHKNDKILLLKEIEYINHLMSLQLQLNTTLVHELSLDIDNELFEISPLLLGFITEQVYQYAALNEPIKSVDISIKVIKDKLHYAAEYKKKKNEIAGFNPNILKQLKQFLELRYQGCYDLTLNEIGECTQIKLMVEGSKTKN